MIITPNFDEAAENEPIQPGVYKARITDVTKKTSKAGNAMLDWKLTIFGAEGDYAKANNRPVFMNTMLEGKGSFRLRDLAKAALGAVPAAWDTDEFLGKHVEIVLVEKRDLQGEISSFPDVKTVRACAA